MTNKIMKLADQYAECAKHHLMMHPLRIQAYEALRAEVERVTFELDSMQKHEATLEDKDKVIHSLTELVKKLYAAKGRYHTQLAACDLFDACGLKNERPVK